MKGWGLRCFAVVLALAAAAPAQAAVFYPEAFTLDNGLQVVVVPNKLSPAVAQMVWYKVGGADEAKGHSGLAHYLEHLMFRGTETMEPGAFSKIIAAQGGSDNAFTSYDYTAYHEIVAADRLEMIMKMEADRMRHLQLTVETATPELGVVLNERQERTDNNPEGKFSEKMQHALFPNHPYGIPVIGWRKEMEKMTAADARAFYAQHYEPNNAVVIISGNVELDQVRRLANETYGHLPRGDVAERPVFPSVALPTVKRVTMVDPGVEQPQLVRNIVTSSYATQKGKEAYALEVLDEVLSGGEVGILYRDLVVKQKIAAGIGVDYDGQARGDAVFGFSVTPQPGHTIKEAEKALDEALKRIAKDGIDPVAIEAAKQRLVRAAIFARDSLMAPGYAFGTALTTGGTVDDVEQWPERIAAVPADDVNAAMRMVLASKHVVTGVLLPDPKATPEEKAKAQDKKANTKVIR